ncbi:hypothetical protein N7468_010469 [Penicillium chermesinum]|uniref:Ubiquitin carboxyl-terminal hydrolase n=1 Tax=Penicillium chermesinum TaxID=63820 RepID=A0A9W9TAT0_9EURO|nr:uncharacterized protein N7468_010469 [Penicillium chermesinum]KAJ5214790.1 hypothetical protein N7468_010469 [Penicillium chermesinum]
MCELKENLWLCLECGNTGCGRSQFGGSKGNSHALAHAESTSHGVAVKLGSITAEGTADVYCYTCNEERTDPELAKHLAHWDIFLAGREKTEKSLMEMQVEHNLSWEFSMTTDDGRELTPVFGPGLTGLINLGNSCYLSSIMQCIFSITGFQDRYYHPTEEPPLCEAPAKDLETQMRKLADGLLSGRYSQGRIRSGVTADSSDPPRQNGLAPAMFKYLIGKGHEEFATMRQQDAFEFLLHLFKCVSLSKHSDGQGNPVKQFRFLVEQRLQCLSCKRARYKIDEQDNISIVVPARRATPGSDKYDLLVVNARRFELVNWVPTKLDIPVAVDDGAIDFEPYLSKAHDPDEELLPDVDDRVTFVPNGAVLDQLLSMGFPMARCEKALHATGNSDPESAMEWLFSHMEDPDIDEPLVLDKSSSKPNSVEQDPAKIAQLGEMGIDDMKAQRALTATGGDVNRALDWVFSHPDDQPVNEDQPSHDEPSREDPPGFDSTPACYQLRSIVCHKGTSVHAGHYVAVIRKLLPGQSEPVWVMFNDEKVAKLEDVEQMKKTAYVYFFTRL